MYKQVRRHHTLRVIVWPHQPCLVPSMSPNAEDIPSVMEAASARPSTPPLENPLPVFCSPVRGHDHSALRGDAGADARYLLAFIDLAPYFREGMSAKAFINEFLPSTVNADTGTRTNEEASVRAVAPPLPVETTQPVREQPDAEQKKSGRKEKGKNTEKRPPPEDAFVSHLYVHPRGHGLLMFARLPNTLVRLPTYVYSTRRIIPTELDQAL
jgi:hypothetical protein